MAIPRQIIRTKFISPLVILKRQKELETKAKQIVAGFFDIRDFNQLIFMDSSRNSFYWVLSQLKRFVRKKKIILAGYNFSLMREIAIKAGFEPLYADASLDDFNISLKSVKKLIDKDVGVAILPHIFGISLKKEIFDELKKQDIFIIEDCAHTYPLSLNIKKQSIFKKANRSQVKFQSYAPGTLGDLSIYSFNFSKQISATYGGLIVLNELNDPKFKGFRDLFFGLNRSLKPKGFLEEIKAYLKSIISSLLFSRTIFSMLIFPMIVGASKRGKEEDIIDKLSNDPKDFKPAPVKRMGKLGLMHLILSIKGFFKRANRLIYIQNEYDQTIKKSEQEASPESIYDAEERKRIQFLYPIVTNDLKSAKRTLLKKGIDVKKNYCVDISNGLCKNAKFLEEHVLYIPFHEKISKREIILIKSEAKGIFM